MAQTAKDWHAEAMAETMEIFSFTISLKIVYSDLQEFASINKLHLRSKLKFMNANKPRGPNLLLLQMNSARHLSCLD